jgi:hypothetical protein
LTGDRPAAEALARETLEQCEKLCAVSHGDDVYWLLTTTMGEARLLLGQETEAVRMYEQAAQVADRKHRSIVSARQQLHLLAGHGFPVPEALFRILSPPVIAVFTGHMIDCPDRPTPRFPASLEEEVRSLIEQTIEAEQVDIGYSGAASFVSEWPDP